MAKPYGNVEAVCNLHETVTDSCSTNLKLAEYIKEFTKTYFDILLIVQSNQSCFEQIDFSHAAVCNMYASGWNNSRRSNLEIN